jgi:NitT/TauT family transport system ATP-binding protein
VKPEGLCIEGVDFSYGAQQVLDSITLLVPKNEIWALVGRSGTGKTTLLNVVAGLFRPTKGQISIAGRPVQCAGRIRGIVFQEDSLLGWLSAMDNMLFPLDRDPSPSLRTRADTLLSAVGLAGAARTMPQDLSTGMRKRLEFARALLADQEYVLADEPFGTVDALTRRDLWQLWIDLRKVEPRTGLLSTHDAEEAVRLCDVVAVLRSSAPSSIGRLITVPGAVHRLKVTEHNEELSGIKEQILDALAERS